MIHNFLKYLKTEGIAYRVTNGYEAIINGVFDDSDYDILFKVSDFININSIVGDFCSHYNYKLVQVYHQEVYAKNFFVYDASKNHFLNLDLYGELSRKGIRLFNEVELFSHTTEYQGISILKPHQEFIQYLIKKVDKETVSETKFNHLKALFLNQQNDCELYLKQFFKKSHTSITHAFLNNEYAVFAKYILSFKEDFKSLKKNTSSNSINNIFRILKRIIKPTGLVIVFLGPDGSGKSTIIEGLLHQTLPFRRYDYFHLKPIPQKENAVQQVVTDPHQYKPYSFLKSYIKLLFFVYQYNMGWLKHITRLKIKSSLVIFDRYYDDVLADHKRYRYGGSKTIAKFIRYFIPKPDLYFILTADADIIHKRKQEVPLEELQRQINEYRSLEDKKRYINMDVSNTPKEIVLEITKIIMQKMNERY
jgi:thymidylate kinase